MIRHENWWKLIHFVAFDRVFVVFAVACCVAHVDRDKSVVFAKNRMNAIITLSGEISSRKKLAAIGAKSKIYALN